MHNVAENKQAQISTLRRTSYGRGLSFYGHKIADKGETLTVLELGQRTLLAMKAAGIDKEVNITE